MPVRWTRRPAAVSEAVVADAEPDLSCAGELEQPVKALIGKVCRPPVGRSVGRSVARSVLVELSISCGGVLCLGSSAAAGALGFPAPGYWILWASRLCSRLVFCHGRCMCVPVGTTPSSSCASLLVSRSLRLSRLGSRVGLQSPVARRGCSLLSRACRLGSRCAVRCFRWTGEWNGLVGLVELSVLFVRLRLRAGQRPATPASDTADATTRFGTHGHYTRIFPATRVGADWATGPSRNPGDLRREMDWNPATSATKWITLDYA